MDARLQLRVQRYGWDRAASSYELAWKQALAPATAAVLTAAKLRPGERVLDVACGSGLLTRAAWHAVAATGGEVVGTDISESMLAEAAEQLPDCRFIRADAQGLDQCVPVGHFDAVLCGLGLMYMPDPEAALATMARCLRPGGRMAVSVWGERRACGWAEIFPIVDSRVRSEVCPMFFRVGTGNTLEVALRAAGLVDVQLSRPPTTIRYADADAACDAAFLSGPVALAYSRFDESTRVSVRAEYLASLEPWRDGERFEIPGTFVIGSGQRPEAAVDA
ncbi:MAG: methyltransferase domain-containing protein [Pseudomonadota bacterium]|nr:methyltransferase domain-containing protein [Pseudomonadota bacterium]